MVAETIANVMTLAGAADATMWSAGVMGAAATMDKTMEGDKMAGLEETTLVAAWMVVDAMAVLDATTVEVTAAED